MQRFLKYDIISAVKEKNGESKLKTAMKRLDRWEEFLALRSRLRIEEGYNPGDSNVEAIKRMGLMPIQGLRGKIVDVLPIEGNTFAAQKAAVAAAPRDEPDKGAGEDDARVTKGGKPFVGKETEYSHLSIGKAQATVQIDWTFDPGTFAGKTCTMSEAVKWVLAHLMTKVITNAQVQEMQEECPSAMAWTYLAMCRTDASFRGDFMLKVGTMLLPKKVEEENHGDDESHFDGKAEYDILARLGGDK